MNAKLLAEIDALYAELAGEIAASGVQCFLSGRCCNFLEVEHTLFATGVEIARAREYLLADPDRRAAAGRSDAALCAFQVEKRCTAREVRPLGCRIYFCEPTWERERAPQIYERYHRRLLELFARYDVAYDYRPFVAAVREALRPPPTD